MVVVQASFAAERLIDVVVDIRLGHSLSEAQVVAHCLYHNLDNKPMTVDKSKSMSYRLALNYTTPLA